MRHKHPHSKGPRDSKGGKPDYRPGRKSHGSDSKPAAKSYGKPGAKPYGKPGAKPDSKNFTKPYAKPDAQPVRKPKESGTPRLTGPLLWGFHAVRAAWMNKDRRVVRLMVTDAGLSGFKDTMEGCSLKRPEPEVLDKLLFDRLMPPGAVHQGIAALVENLPGRDAHDLIASLKDDEPATLVILDQVTDPHNVGAILRSAAAFGARGVIMQDRHAPELAGVLAKTASGAADVIPVAVETNLSRAIEMLQEAGFVVVGLDERGDPIGDLPHHDRLVLVLGAEGSGLRPNVANHCDALVCLPTQGDILSLNVSNAAAVALYAIKK